MLSILAHRTIYRKIKTDIQLRTRTIKIKINIMYRQVGEIYLKYWQKVDLPEKQQVPEQMPQ